MTTKHKPISVVGQSKSSSVLIWPVERDDSCLQTLTAAQTAAVSQLAACTLVSSGYMAFEA